MASAAKVRRAQVETGAGVSASASADAGAGAGAGIVPLRGAVLRTPAGASVEADGERLVVRDTRGAVVVVYDAERGTAEIRVPEGDLTLAAPKGKISLLAQEVECEAGRIELRADRIFERARDVYREVEGLLQSRAERVRTLARGAYHVFAKRVNVAAEEDASVDGKRVLLG